MKKLTLALFAVLPLLASAQLGVDFNVTPPACANYTNGSIQAMPSGGTAPYTYHWSNDQNGQTTYGVGAGTYSITLTDATGSTETASVAVTAPPLLQAGILPLANVCDGNMGTFQATANGGTPAYGYLWSNGETASSLTNPEPGYYFVTVTDANGCEDIAGMAINAALTSSVHVIDVVCAGLCDGSAEAIISGGTAPYTFLWNTGATDQVIWPLPPGDYTVTVTDGNGCTSVSTGTIFEPPAILIAVDVDGNCDGNASAFATATGGMPPFSYLWSNGVSGQQVTGLSPGTYFVVVTDANDCKEDAMITVSNGSAVVIADAENTACDGLDTGSAKAVPTLGVGPFEFLWSNGQTTQTATALAAGTYTVTLTDAAGCTATASATIESVSGIALAASATEAGCNGSAFGTATANVTAGGTAPFSFLWSNGQNSQTATGLAAGTYTVTVTDALGCTATASAIVTPTPNNLVLTANATQPTCEGASAGAAMANVIAGGTAPFSFIWNNGQNSQTATGLSAGTYSVTVTDALACTTIASAVVNEVPNDLEIGLSATDAGCGNVVLGTATASVISGGTPSFQFFWNDGQNTQTATNLVAGTYMVTLTDANGCTASGEIEVEQSNPLTILVQSANANCHNTADGSANVALVSNNAEPPLSYEWSNGETIQAVGNLLPGSYAVTVTDANGCTGSVPVTVGANASIMANFTYEIDGCPEDTATVQFTQTVVFSPISNPILTWEWTFSDGQSANVPDPLMAFTDSSITATLVVENATGCRDTVSQELDLQNVLDVTFPSADTGCVTDTLELSVNFDPAAMLTFDWSTTATGISILGNGQPTVQIVANDTGVFVVNIFVEDENGCFVEESATVSFSSEDVPFDPSFVSFTQCDSTTLDFSNGNPQAGSFIWFFDHPDDPTATATGPNPSYTYTEPGSYTVLLVPDADCAIDTFLFVVTVEEPPLAAFTYTNTGCSQTDTLTFLDASVTPSDITAWLWEFSNGTTATGDSVRMVVDSSQFLIATLTIEFESGCMATVSDTVEVRVFQPNFLPDTVIACRPGLMAELNPDADPSFDYLWSPTTGLSPGPTAPNPTATVTATTTYSVIVSGMSGPFLCATARDVTAFVPDAVGLTVSDDVTDCEPGTATVSASSSTSPVDFVWSDSPNFSNILSEMSTYEANVTDPPTTYFVQVEDAFGCTETGEVSVGYYPVMIQVPDLQDDCLGNTPVVQVSGTGPEDQIVWIPTDPNTITLNDTTDYVVTVTNPFGCTASDTVTINAIDLNQLIDVTPVLDTILAGESTQLNVIANFEHFCSWTNGETLNDDLACDPMASPTQTTTYTVEVENSIGCRGSGTSTVCVVNNLCDEPMIYVPTAFTPNGDGLNDVLFVRGYNIERVLIFAIYDRWGTKVFESRSLDEGWDGTYDGRTITGDSFAYYLKVECITGEEFFKKGNVTVLR